MLELLQSKPSGGIKPPFVFNLVTKPNTPLALGHGSAGVLNGELYLLGGYIGGGNRTNRAFKFNPSANSWSEIAARPENFGTQCISFELNGRLITTNFAGDGFTRYNPITNSWDVMSTPTFPEKIDSTRPFAIYGDKLVVLLLNATTSLAIYNFKTNTWEQVPLSTPPAIGSVFVHYQNKLFLIARNKRMVSLNLDTLVWTEYAPMPIAGTAFYGADCFEYDDKFYVVGGWNGTSINQLCFVYDIKTDTWTQPITIPGSGYTNNVRGIAGKFYLLKANSTGGAASGTNTFTQLN